MANTRLTPSHALNDLGYKIFLDRYALKDMTRQTLAVGDLVIVLVNPDTRQREIGEVQALDLPQVTVRLRDGAEITCSIEEVDKPLETDPAQMMARVAQGVAAVEESEELQAEWSERFRWLLDEWKFVPGGRILAAAGTNQSLTFYNCYVVPAPHDSRDGIIETLRQMTEIMSRGGGVGINISSLRPRYAYVRGVNGRSSGTVSWGELYSFVTGLIEQGGCLVPDTLVFTEQGLLRLDEIVEHDAHGWRKHMLPVMTDQGARVSRQVYNNGVADVLAVNTDMGLTITGTPNHKVKVMTDQGPAWRALEQLQTGDAILVKLNQHRGQTRTLAHPAIHHHNQAEVQLPTVLDEELAFFLGYFMGDGFMTTRDGDWRLGVAVAHSSYLVDEMPRLMERLFSGVNVRIQQKENDAASIYLISNRAVKEFLTLNGLDKRKSDEVRVPRLIRQSPRRVVGAFLSGLFEADGGISHGYPALSSISKSLIDEVATLLIGLGCPVKVEPFPSSADRYGSQTVWRVRVHSFWGLDAWKTNIGCDARSRYTTSLDFEPDLNRETTYVLPNPAYWVEPVLKATALPQIDHRATGARVKATDGRLRRKLLCYKRGDRNLTLPAYTTLEKTHPDFAGHARPVNDTWFVLVDSVQSAGQAPTLDLEVDDNHTYLANGVVTHNSRRGALMLILNDWHPDILEFTNSKRNMDRMTNANISVGISDKFMNAVELDEEWDLVFPDTDAPGYNDLWDGDLEKWQAAGHPVIHYQRVRARDLWHAIIESAWASAEPGIWFRERTNKLSNSHYFSPLICTNPCGEQPLSAWSVCNLGAINLAKFYDAAVHDVAWDDLRQTAAYATRFLDNVIDTTPYFFPENEAQQKRERRIGIGTMGLAELMIHLGIRYGSDESLAFIDRLYEFLTTTIYEASARIADEKGPFPMFEAEPFLQSGFMQSMPERIRALVREKGMRNVTTMTQAPTGTTGTMVGTSTGIEPFFSWMYFRKSRLGMHEEQVPLVQAWFEAHPDADHLPDYFVTAMELSPEEHIRVQAAIQRWVDSAISKTSNVPNHYTVGQTRELYESMYRLGCKGGTIYRDGSRNEQVLSLKQEEEKAMPETTTAPASTPVPPAVPEPDTLPQVASPHRVYPRPRMLTGVTASVKTPFGTAYITMNSDEEDNPFEVFVTIGKAGSDLQADAEGLGRMISLLLRTTAPANRRDMLKLIIEQLRNIGGARSVGLGQGRISSLPDAVASTLEQVYFPDPGGQQLSLPGLPTPQPVNDPRPEPPAAPASNSRNGHGAAPRRSRGMDMCPACGTISLVRAEGCRKCLACDYSEC